MQNSKIVPDLHTHILHRIDDGPRSVEDSIEILKAQKRQGITDVAFTPHFNIEDIDTKSFLERRDKRYYELMEAVKNEPGLDGMHFYRASEVAYSPNLIYEDLSVLCYEGTYYFLLELSISYPFNLENTVSTIVSKGYRPILAHIERYPYLTGNLALLDELAGMGAVFQANASAIVGGAYKKEVRMLLKKGYIDILCSDTHDLNKRPPLLAEALLKLKGKGSDMISNAVRIITNTDI